MALSIQEVKMFKKLKYYIINLFAILLFLFANQSVFANEYWQEYRNSILETGISVEMGRGTMNVAKGGTELFNFGKTAAGHMANPARKVPIQILDDVIKNTKGLPDPRGSKGLMHYSEIFKIWKTI